MTLSKDLVPGRGSGQSKSPEKGFEVREVHWHGGSDRSCRALQTYVSKGFSLSDGKPRAGVLLNPDTMYTETMN